MTAGPRPSDPAVAVPARQNVGEALAVHTDRDRGEVGKATDRCARATKTELGPDWRSCAIFRLARHPVGSLPRAPGSPPMRAWRARRRELELGQCGVPPGRPVFGLSRRKRRSGVAHVPRLRVDASLLRRNRCPGFAAPLRHADQRGGGSPGRSRPAADRHRLRRRADQLRRVAGRGRAGGGRLAAPRPRSGGARRGKARRRYRLGRCISRRHLGGGRGRRRESPAFAIDWTAILGEAGVRWILTDSRDGTLAIYHEQVVTQDDWRRAIAAADPVAPALMDEASPAFWGHSRERPASRRRSSIRSASRCIASASRPKS